MIRRAAASLASLMVFACVPAQADVGEPAQAVLTRVQSSKTFAHAPSDHGTIPQQHLERWKFETAHLLEQRIFSIDAKNINAPVVRETYIRITALDPYSLRPGQGTGNPDLADVLSPRERADFVQGAFAGKVSEAPLHVTAYFYRGKFAAYEVLEPAKRKSGAPDQFEWRSFPLRQLDAVMKAARSV
jgi:hypothetical protein